MSMQIPSQDTQSSDVSTYDLLKAEDAKQEEPKTEDLLAEEETKDEEPTRDTDTDEDDKSTDESDETAEDDLLEEDDVVDEIEAAIQVPVKVKEVLAKYPNIKKEFPELFTANFREKQYAELLPTIDDAKEAVEKAATLDKFEQTIFSGDAASILQVVKDQEPAAFGKIVDSYLPQLKKVDEKAYWHVVGGLANDIAQEMFAAGKQHNNEDLQAAAKMMYDYIFRGAVPAKQYSEETKPESEEMRKLKKEREEFENSKLSSVRGDVERVSDNSIKSTIDKNIDPKGVMTAYVRRNAINDCMKIVKDSMTSDKRFTATVDTMWKKAKENGYKTPEVENIKRLVLGKARSVLREAILRTRTEALKGISQKTSSEPARKIKVKESPSSNNKGEVKERARGKTTFQLLSED